MTFDIPARIRELRTSQKMSTNKLSNKAGLSQSYGRKLERGECSPTIDSLELICDALDIALEDFISFGSASLLQLRAIKLIHSMTEDQLEAFCTLMGPSVKEQDENSSGAEDGRI